MSELEKKQPSKTNVRVRVISNNETVPDLQTEGTLSKQRWIRDYVKIIFTTKSFTNLVFPKWEYLPLNHKYNFSGYPRTNGESDTLLRCSSTVDTPTLDWEWPVVITNVELEGSKV